MDKKILLIFILIGIFPLISAQGSILIEPNIIEQNNYMKITIFPTSAGMVSAGTINEEGGYPVTAVDFNCTSYRCFEPKSVSFYVNPYMHGNYYISVWDDEIHDFVHGNFKVVGNSCKNQAKDGNETDIDCGGGKCSSCSENKSCLLNSDCKSYYCGFNDKCINNKSIKNRNKYSNKEVFLISDENWKNVLKLVPVTTWNENSQIIKYPVLIYHKEENKFDFDSGVHFMQLYAPSHISIFGESPEKLDKLLLSNNKISQEEIRQNPGKYLGAGLKKEQISKISFNDYYSYWNEIRDIIVSENDYKAGLISSVFASYKNAPLIFEDEIDYDVLKGKNIYLIGNIDEKVVKDIKKIANSSEVYSVEEAQKEYIQLTNSSKVIIVNADDLDIKLEKSFRTRKSSKVKEIYNGNSLIAGFLAAERNELIIPLKIPVSPDNSKCEENQIIIDNFNLADNQIEQQIKKLFDKKPEYLTIIASPNSIPDSLYIKCHKTKEQYREAIDWKYATLDNKTMKVGRIYGLTLSDASSYIAKEIFYDKIFNEIYEDKATGLGIGHSFKKYSDNMQKIYNASAESNYEIKCYTGEKKGGCVNKVKVPLSEYSKKQFIIFGDHGYANEWVDTLDSNEVPWLDLSYVFSHACSTNNYWKGKEELMGASMIRQGALAYYGAVGISYADNSESIALQKITSSNISLGELNKELIESLNNYKKEFIMIGDPLFEPKFKKINWTEISFINFTENESELKSNDDYDVQDIQIISIQSEKEVYSPEDNIFIKIKVKNNSSEKADLELEKEIYSDDGYNSEIYSEEINLEGEEEKEFDFSMEVINTMPSGNYGGVVRLIENNFILDEKEVYFNVENTLEEIKIILKSCDDEKCENEERVFEKNKKIYLDYESSSSVNIDAILKSPEGSEREISLPYNFSSEIDGDYLLKINASKEGYESIEKEIIFGIIGKTEIDIEEVCNADDICEGKETIQNCPQDCIHVDVPEDDENESDKNPHFIEDNYNGEIIEEKLNQDPILSMNIIDIDNQKENNDLNQIKLNKLDNLEKEIIPVYWIIIIFALLYIILIISILILMKKIYL